MHSGQMARRVTNILLPVVAFLPTLALATDEDECPKSYKALRETERIVLEYRQMHPPNWKNKRSDIVSVPNPLIGECLIFRGKIEVVNRQDGTVRMAIPAKFNVDMFSTGSEQREVAKLERAYEKVNNEYHNFMRREYADLSDSNKKRMRSSARIRRKKMQNALRKLANYKRKLRERVDNAAHMLEIHMGGVELETEIGHREEIAVNVIDATWDNNAVVPALTIEAVHRDAKALPPVTVGPPQAASFAEDVFVMCDQLLSDYPQPRPRETSIQAKRRRASAIDDVKDALLDKRLTFELQVEDIVEERSTDRLGQFPYVMRAKPISSSARQLRDVRFRFGDYAAPLLDAARGDTVMFVGMVDRVEFGEPRGRQPLSYSIEGQVVDLIDANDQKNAGRRALIPAPSSDSKAATGASP